MTLPDIPEGWTLAYLWESVTPKDRPWWGCSLRRDEPYKVVSHLGATSASGAMVNAIAQVKGIQT